MRAFQAANGLPVDGQIGTATWESLLNFTPYRMRWSGSRARAGTSSTRVTPPSRPLSASLPARAYEIRPVPPLEQAPGGGACGHSHDPSPRGPRRGGAARPRPEQRAAFAVPHPAPPLRDVVRPGGRRGRRAHRRHRLERSATRSTTAAAPRSRSTSAPTAQQQCDAADPQAIANTIGTFIHGPEVNLLTVQLDTPFELGFDCGFEAQSCYFGGENKIVLSGDDDPRRTRASRDFVLAHEYGHHVAQHRDMPAPFPAAINWGPERWASVEHVCQGHRAGALFPGDEGSHYYEDPGEAFAESFAFNRYPEAAVKWAWAPALHPTSASLAALRRRHPAALDGAATASPSKGACRSSGAVVQEFRTPFDGRVSVGPVGEPGLGYQLVIRNRSGDAPAQLRARASPSATASTTPSAASPACGSRSRRPAKPGNASD